MFFFVNQLVMYFLVYLNYFTKVHIFFGLTKKVLHFSG